MKRQWEKREPPTCDDLVEEIQSFARGKNSLGEVECQWPRNEIMPIAAAIYARACFADILVNPVDLGWICFWLTLYGHFSVNVPGRHYNKWENATNKEIEVTERFSSNPHFRSTLGHRSWSSQWWFVVSSASISTSIASCSDLAILLQRTTRDIDSLIRKMQG